MSTDDDRHLRRCIELARRAGDKGNHPFGALLVDARGEVVIEAENTVVTDRDVTAHAETNLVRLAGTRFDSDFLQACTLYASTEPCAMCAGAIFWSNLRCVVFASSGEEIRALRSGSSALAVSCREVFARGDHEVEVRGPHLEDEVLAMLEARQ